jgi:hypothetical protein
MPPTRQGPGLSRTSGTEPGSLSRYLEPDAMIRLAFSPTWLN